ncbi:MAG: hypothetical protein V7756_11510 [Halopseudomonas sp.]|uniref:hypothetical protein n=1 Tax=Halopseudomonas sp. TaxID=2901191 RepID=UPI0030038565
MIRILLPLCVLLSGCIAYQVSPPLDDQLSASAHTLRANPAVSINTSVERVGDGNLCAMTSGLIPSPTPGCPYLLKARLLVSDGAGQHRIEQEYRVNRLQGFDALFGAPSSAWIYRGELDARAVERTLLNRYVETNNNNPVGSP